MKYGLTPRQQECRDFIKEFTHNHGYSPSIEEINEALKLNSKSRVHRLVLALEERGAIVRLPFRNRSLRVVE